MNTTTKEMLKARAIAATLWSASMAASPDEKICFRIFRNDGETWRPLLGVCPTTATREQSQTIADALTRAMGWELCVRFVEVLRPVWRKS